jgi:hypothetical protein
MVNKISNAQKEGQISELEIALFEYGNSTLSAETGYIRLVQPLSKDLDGLSEKLFSLKTNGGDEYCGWAIQTAQELLSWSNEPGNLKIIVIAGNEPFDQGRIDFRVSCGNALQHDIIINTIHCGDYQTGVTTHWKDGANLGNGKYLHIDTDQKVVHINTPYDTRMMQLNDRLNKTYIGYGHSGLEKKRRQIAQDENAAAYGEANTVQRAAAKAKSSYNNDDWDIVDASKKDKSFVKNIPQEALPEELKGKNPEELEKEIERFQKERDTIRTEMVELEKQMQAYIVEEQKKQVNTQTLDNVLIETVVSQAKAKGFTL